LLVSGIAAVAVIFSYASRTNINTEQRTTATLLLHEKLEQLRIHSISDADWAAGNHEDYPVVAGIPYIRQWQIADTVPKSITMVVSVERAGLTGRRMELTRAVMLVGKSF
jgi:Tfp pilus assembly protein PilV